MRVGLPISMMFRFRARKQDSDLVCHPWQRLLRPGSSLAVTEVSWLIDEPPDPIRGFWNTSYPAMRSREANELTVANAGYRLLGSFVLPEAEWWDDYYTPIDERIAALRKERSDDDWVAALDSAEAEAAIVRCCNGSFGYVFYVMQKPAHSNGRSRQLVRNAG